MNYFLVLNLFFKCFFTGKILSYTPCTYIIDYNAHIGYISLYAAALLYLPMLILYNLFLITRD